MSDEAKDYLIIPNPDHVLDCSGLFGPLTVIETSKTIKQIAIGQVLQMITTDPGAPRDMAAWSSLTGNDLLDSRQEGGKFIFYFQRVK